MSSLEETRGQTQNTLERLYLAAAWEHIGVPPDELMEMAWERSLPAQTAAPVAWKQIKSRNETKFSLGLSGLSRMELKVTITVNKMLFDSVLIYSKLVCIHINAFFSSFFHNLCSIFFPGRMCDDNVELNEMSMIKSNTNKPREKCWQCTTKTVFLSILS